MFRHTTSDFGAFTLHRLSDAHTDNYVELAPERGACITDIVLQGRSILDGNRTPIDLDLNNWGKSGLLYPFPNRLKLGAYKWQGNTYQFPLNDVPRDNALHGFGMAKPITVDDITLTTDSASISGHYDYPGDLHYYPFPFIFRFGLTLRAGGAVELELGVTNTGSQSIPMGFGWHPYFQLAEKIESVELKLPDLQMVGVDQDMIPTGKRYAYDEFAAWRPIGATVLDNCFAIPPSSGDRLEIGLRTGERHLRYWQETGEGKFQFVQLFTPPMRESIAIEPMTCNIDAFNNGEGLIELEAGQSVSARCGLELLRRTE